MKPCPGPATLHVLTDETLQSRFDHVELTRLATAGGADVVQLREKRDLPDARMLKLARGALAEARARGARLIVNDRVRLAVQVGADGVHLGRDDLPADEARRRLGARAWIGATANSVEEALAVARTPIDYLGVGPVFGTLSKAAPAPVLGLETLRQIVRAVDKPVIAIGNITPEHVGALLETGARGIAVLSAVVCHSDPAEATARFRRALDRRGAR